jgi:hypothetical protein
MKYFNSFITLDELKTEYRRLAKENHPDHGGDSEAMKEINAEFDLAFRIIEKKAQAKTSNAEPETAGEYRRNFYTENGWAGSRYNPNLRLRDIAPIVRRYVKDVYPTWKFSVRTEYFANGCAINITLTEVPENIFPDEKIRESALAKQGTWQSYEEAYQCIQKVVESGYMQNWQWHYSWMSDKAIAVLQDVEALIQSYRYDDSDNRFDYFDTNFYTHLDIGKGRNKPLKIVPRRERISHNNGPEGARRITA